ncbi:hypothetical protein TEA_006048 [Camellia sinensis var. sinensis]|uniref:DNA mismatch repair proteins mutS family domain-containing protein n=1 Tax=Camellia sinensis var. sinensis TaxID=542762 RepID=A0A4S4DSR8_CAMSN|nr:hypothetical protein TEA_006048 [Camellia sinensis var. sinensis]
MCTVWPHMRWPRPHVRWLGHSCGGLGRTSGGTAVALIVFLSHIGSFVPAYDPPKVLVCTHLTEIFNDSCIQESDNIKYYTMSVLRPDDGTDIEDIVFLYRLVPGHALLSYGVPEEVIKRAASLLNAIGNNNHVDRLCNDKISAQDRQYKDTIDKMLSFDACNGDLNLFFQDIFPS